MGRLPYLSMAPKEQHVQISTFLGLNAGSVIAENEFADMKNMTADKWPAAAAREPRGEVMKQLDKPNGIYYKDGILYADGGEVFYKNEKIADVTDTEKVFVGMGAYILIWPDKLMYNTADGKLEPLDASWQQTDQARFEPLAEGSTMIKVTSKGIGTAFRNYDGVTMSGCTNEDFNKTFIIQGKEEDSITLIGILDKAMSQDRGLKIERSVPDMDFICENENRIWGCSSKNHEIYSCKLGDAKNWNAFEGISTDSYAVTVGSDGDFTGCISYLGYVMFFKEDAVHKVYGNKPTNYQVMTSGVNGVAKGCEKSMAVVNETLFYAARNGICRFNGAQPELVSGKLPDKRVTGAVAGMYRNKYYISIKAEGWGGFYVFDAEKGLWSKEDGLQIRYAVYGEGELYCIDGNGNLFTVSGKRKETLEWMLETGDLLDGSFEYKHVRQILLHVQMARDSEMTVSIRYDDDPEWVLAETVHAEVYRSQTINLVPRRCISYRIRLQGVGGFVLKAITKRIGYGTEIHGSS